MTRPGTRAEAAFAALRADILTGRLLPGQRLQFDDMTGLYGASVGVLREALSRLAEQGLVLAEPQQGFRVVPVSPDDLLDLTAARVEIETMALRRALEHGDLAWESRLIAAHHVLDGTPQLVEGDPPRVNEEWATAHARFHDVLLEACPIRRLRDIARSLRDSAELYRRWSRHLGSENGRDIPGEHRALLDAAISHDVEQAVALLSDHIQYTTNAVLAAGALSAESGDASFVAVRRTAPKRAEASQKVQSATRSRRKASSA